MPEAGNRAIALRQKPRGDAWGRRGVRSWAFSPRACPVGAIITVIPLWLGACSPSEPAAQAPPASLGSSITVQPLTGPIALAPSVTGAPAPAAATPEPSPMPAPPPAPPPAPAPAVAMPAPPPAPAPVAEASPPPAPAPVAATPPPAIFCPPGATAVWSEPDLAGTPVAICRRLPTGR